MILLCSLYVFDKSFLDLRSFVPFSSARFFHPINMLYQFGNDLSKHPAYYNSKMYYYPIEDRS